MKNILKISLLFAVLATLLTGCEKDFNPDKSHRSSIKSFTFTTKLNNDKGVQTDSRSVVDGDKIVVFVDNACVDYSSLIPTFALSDRALAYVNGTVQDSGKNAQDFSQPVVYEVVAENGEKHDYTVQVVTEKPIIDFTITKLSNNSLLKDAISIRNNDKRYIRLELPAGSGLGTYIPTFTLPEGMKLMLNGSEVISGVTPVDFTKVETFEVTSNDGYPRQWSVETIVHIIRHECNIESFMFKAELSPSVFRDVVGVVDTTAHTVIVPSYWADLTTKLIPTFTVSEYAKAEVNGVSQVSEVTANNFKDGVVYKVLAEDGQTSKDWTVKIVRPTRFRMPDRTLREYIRGLNSSLFDGDSLIISKAIDWLPTGDVWGKHGFWIDNVNDFTGIEFFSKLQATVFSGSTTAKVLDLSKNHDILQAVWWNSSYTELNISGCGNGVNQVEVNQTAGTQLKRLICRNVAYVFINTPQRMMEYVDFRGGKSTFDSSQNNCTFVANAKVLMNKSLWDTWGDSVGAYKEIKAAQNMTLELYADDGTTLLQTLKFNE